MAIGRRDEHRASESALHERCLLTARLRVS
jgi:hypothetical protein